MSNHLFKNQLMMPYFKSNNNSTSQVTTTNNNTPIKLPQFDNPDAKDHYLAPQNYRYLSLLPGFSTYTHGLPIASVNTAPNQIAAKEKIIPQLKSPLQQVPEEQEDDEGKEDPQQQQQYHHQLNQHEYHLHSCIHPHKFDLFNSNDEKIPRNLPNDVELEFVRATNHSNNDNNKNKFSASILQQLQVLPTENIDVYDYLNPRKSANMGYREKIRSWLASVPLAIAYDESLTQFNLNCYPGVVSASETASNSDAEIDLADVDDVLELQAQRVTRYVNRLYFNEEEIPLPIEEIEEDLENEDLEEEEEDGEDGDGADQGEEGGMLGIEEYNHNPALPERNENRYNGRKGVNTMGDLKTGIVHE